MTEWVFWVAAVLILYAYVGYPVLLGVLAGGKSAAERCGSESPAPTVSLIIPVYNERRVVEAKLANSRALEYPKGGLEVLFVSDGSDDGTAECVRGACDGRTRLIDLVARSGKAAALNAGLAAASGEIIVFSDASIMLSPDAIREIVQPFDSRDVGCVSGEDRVVGTGGEALYGRYELFLRRQESRLHSIVGASGCFYAQRRSLCEPFPAGEAPDFFSVLRTVERGYRAVSAPSATGLMTAVGRSTDEFERKVRTLLRGMTTLGRHAGLLNPSRHGFFALELLSHKLLRWVVPFLLIALLASSAILATGSPWYRFLFYLQAGFYALALAGLTGVRPLAKALPVRIALYFSATNAAALTAWIKYLGGFRQELWAPSRRS